MEHPAALIVSHGQPGDPGPAAAELAGLAQRVAVHLPAWRVASATLAEPGALAQAIAGLGPRGLVYPMFMAGGWFTSVQLPRLLAKAGGVGWRVLPPFGVDPAIQALCVTQALEAAARLGLPPAETAILLAAHGSFRSPAPAQVAQKMAAQLTRAGFARAEAYFIDQSPKISAARGFGPASLCLPFFAARGAHVTVDLPAALTVAGFMGQVLAPLGLDARAPALIAAALRGWVG